MRILLIVILNFVTVLRATPVFSAECFDPSTDKSIGEYLKPVPKYFETDDVIFQMHTAIWQHRTELDPRLIYYRMFGESRANPEAVDGAGRAYGLFQLQDSPPHSKKKYRQIFKELEANDPKKSPRLIQIQYYLEHYLQNARSAADHGAGCNKRKVFSQYSNYEKSAYLGFGDCSSSTIRRERQLCLKNLNYREVACKIAGPAFAAKPVPLCEDLKARSRTSGTFQFPEAR